MRRASKLALLTFLTVLSPHLVFPVAQAQIEPGDTTRLRSTVDAFISDFRERAQASGAGLRYRPRVKLQITPQLIYFNEADSTMVIPWWEGLDGPVQESFAVLVYDPRQGRRLFLELFNWFLLPHELIHGLQAQYARPWKPYASEAEANEGAVDYWVAAGEELRLLALDSALALALTRLPNPTPAGQEAAAYFDQNYEALGANPQAYGYYQFRFIREAIASRRTRTFDGTLHRLAPSP